ncbi:DNA-3-methyladenine glycosylase family protein [Georgenia soli]|uniref:DNA-3-methyladenine glycosylase family protein n=1 Tax=Georgenia soli TaxID=638953 RepID=UPI000BF53DDB|nr:DNA-3-methyladenine glycosylase [Georgenia soli]
MQVVERTWVPAWPCAVGQTLAVLRHGPADPTVRFGAGVYWRGMRTPAGPATLRLEVSAADGGIRAAAWGAGAAWAVGAVPAMLGAEDDPSGFRPDRHPQVARLAHHFPHLRLPRTGLVMESLVPAIIEQRVTGTEAFAGHRRLVHFYGERAPGPGADLRLWVPPTPQTLAAIPSWQWLRLGIDPARSRTIVGAARVAPSLERAAGVSAADADLRLRSLPGIGVWTSAETRMRSHGDADAVSFGDYNVARDVGWALTGKDGVDDDGLAELLEPFRPHRYRVQRLVELAGIRRPRRGARMPLRTHLPVAQRAQ